MRAAFRPLILRGEFNPLLRAAFTKASGAYVIRERDSRRVVYVGESHTGNGWKTLIRHFHAPSSFAKVRETFTTAHPERYDAAVFVTSKGHRTEENRDQAAVDMQAALIGRYRKRGAELVNVTDGQATVSALRTSGRDSRLAAYASRTAPPPDPDTDFDFGANVATDDAAEPRGAFDDMIGNPAAPRVVVDAPAERRAENRTPDLFTGRTRLEDKDGKARRDWKKEAERAARELAECRAASVKPARETAPETSPRPVAPRPPAPPPKFDARGQRLLIGNPGAPPMQIEDFLFEASRWDEGERPRVAYSLGDQHVVVRDGKEIAVFRTREMADWFLESWATAATDARVHKKISELIGPPPGKFTAALATATRNAGNPLVWGEFLGGAHGDDLERAIVASADRKGRAEFIAALMNAGIGFARDTAAARAAAAKERGHRIRYDMRHSLNVGEWVSWETQRTGKRGGIVDHKGKIAELVEGDRIRISPEFSRRRGVNRWTLEPEYGLTLMASSVRPYTPPEAPPKKPRASRKKPAPKKRAPWTGSERAMLLAIDGAAYHALGVAAAPWKRDDPAIVALINRQAVKVAPARGRFPERYVLTGTGSHLLGGFESDDPDFRAKGRELGARARAKKAAAARAKPEGCGAEETTKKKAGQLRLFNPAELVELGRLTELSYLEGKRTRVMRWGFRVAPLLAYLPSSGRLFILYNPRKIGTAGKGARKEYAKTHWGQRGKGDLLECVFLEGDSKGCTNLGTSTFITYTTRKGTDANRVDYVHEWGEGGGGAFKAPTVQRGPRGTIRLIGGSYRVTERGIVG